MYNISTVEATANWAPGWSMVSALATVAAVFVVFVAIRQFRFEAWLRTEELVRMFHEDRAQIFARLPSCDAPLDGGRKGPRNGSFSKDEYCRLPDEFLAPPRGA